MMKVGCFLRQFPPSVIHSHCLTRLVALHQSDPLHNSFVSLLQERRENRMTRPRIPEELPENPPPPLPTPIFPNVVDFTAAHGSSRPAEHLLSRQWPPKPDSSQLERSLCRASSNRDLRPSQQLQHQQHPPLRRGRTPRGELRGVHCQVRYRQWVPRRELLSMFLHSRNDACSGPAKIVNC